MKQVSFDGMGMNLEEVLSDSIELLREHVPEGGEPYYGCFSGGKDSVVIKEVARLAEVPVEWHYNVTTIDPPELVRFMKEHHPEVIWDRAPEPFFYRMVKKGFPTRRARWCCEEYKERRPPKGVIMIMGIRAEESARRAATWEEITFHRRTRAWALSPILRWTVDHVWEFIRSRELPYCSLYDEGFHRLGCIGCPMARRVGKEKEFKRWPKFEKNWRRAFKRLWERRLAEQPTQMDGREWVGIAKFNSWEEMWEWWLSDDPLPGDPDSCPQLDMWG